MQESNLIRFYTETTTETNNVYNGIMVSSSDDNETETTIASQVSFSKQRNVDKAIVAFMNWYFAYYKRELGDEHPQLKTAQKHKVHDHLKAFRDEYCIDENGLKEMAEAFFKNVTTTDYNINHFVDPSILENRYYDALYRGSGEWEE